ncbi:MAG TPA: hypothetical protein VHW71_03595 [Steroidobacteraceae bacterium]|jgi:hypothetical protein|nr:hypothetical protein [Steroidobacteraceae bacterium]
MQTQRDLLPWILGGLLVVAAAVAFTAVSTTQTAGPSPPPVHVLAARAVTAAPRASVATPPPVLSAAPPRALPQPDQTASTAQPAAQDQVPVAAGQIWQCTTNGVKTFSNNPCGEKSSLLDVGPVNTMHPPPAASYARSYAPQPQYVPAYSGQSDDDAQDAYADESGAEAGGNSYTIVQGVRILPRRHADHRHRPPSHHSSRPESRKF